MFRIIRFEVDFDSLVKRGETRRDQVKRLYEIADLQSSNGVFYTKAMSTTSPEYFETEQIFRSMFGDGTSIEATAESRETTSKWVVIDYSDVYRLLRTRAPRSYDYAYVIEVGVMQGEFGEERLVAMPEDRVEYQSGRYSSGLFTPVLCS